MSMPDLKCITFLYSDLCIDGHTQGWRPAVGFIGLLGDLFDIKFNLP